MFWQQQASGPYGWWSPYPGPWVTATVPIPASVGGDLYTGLAMTWPVASAICGPGRPNPLPFCTFQVDSGGMLLANDSSPAGSRFGGSLLASGPVHGTADLTFTATDPGGPGVYRVIVKIDGSTAYQATPDTNRGRCVSNGTDPTSGAWIFDSQQPCPTTVDLDVPVNTTTLRDGEHELQVLVEDAAQNTSTVLDQQVTTDNLTSVASTTSEGIATSPATATYAFKLDRGTDALTGSVIRRRYERSSLTLSGTVLDSAGAPAPGVSVSVQAWPLSGTGPTTVAQALTDGSGHFALAVPRGNSRQLKLTAGANDVVFKELVTPNVSLTVRSLPRARLSFTGNIAIDQAGNPRPLVELEDHTPTGWLPIATTTVNNAGRFRYLYRVSPLAIGYSFQFRAVTPAVGGYWQGAASGVHEATVKA